MSVYDMKPVAPEVQEPETLTLILHECGSCHRTFALPPLVPYYVHEIKVHCICGAANFFDTNGVFHRWSK